MQHSSHSHHPLPHGQHEIVPAPAQASNASPSSAGLISRPRASPHQSPTPHGRRLQLRNARFTTSSIPARRISPILGLAVGPVESFNRAQDSERSPPSIEKRSFLSQGLPRSPVNILQEVQNCARRKMTTSEEGFVRIFQDSSSVDENNIPLDDGETSWYEEKSNECTPSAPHAPTSATALRECSLNQKSPTPLSYPSAKQTRGRARALSSLSADNSVEQSRYIEHLESQLASAQAKIDGLTSPKTNKLRSVKLRSLTTENRNLAKDNAEWAKRAEETVEEEKKRYASLKLEMKSLEEDLEIKDARIVDLEWDLDTMRAQVRNAEGLEEANANLEKKIDMLSGLLVNSPHKPGMQSAATSPKKIVAQVSPAKRRPRPISVLSRVSSSPNGARISLASASETAFWDSRSRSTSILETQENATFLESHNRHSQSPIPDVDNISPGSSKRLSFTDSFDDRRNSTSFTSRTGPSSRPTSFMSTSSAGVPTWGVPTQHDSEAKYSNRQRKMRKFPSGSNTLKPLILPVASNANVQSQPASAPIYPSIDTVAYRDLSESSSIDPTMAFLAHSGDHHLLCTPTIPLRARSITLAREETLNALEGRRPERSTPRDEIDEDDCMATGCSPEVLSGLNDIHCHHRAKPRDLKTELEQARLEQPYLDGAASSRADTPTDECHLVEIRRSGSRQSSVHPSQFNLTPRAHGESLVTQPATTPPTLRPQNRALLDPTPDCSPSLFARITSLITQTKQDPYDLARRILVNAWTLGCVSLGGLAWWLIGPMHHHHQRCRPAEDLRQSGCHETTDRHSRDWMNKTQPWQHFSAEIRNGRLVDSGYFGGSVETPSIPGPQETCRCLLETPCLSFCPRDQPHLFPCDECIEPSSRRTFRVWFQFSLSMVLAVGLAVKYGPGVLLAELSRNGHTTACLRPTSEEEQYVQEHLTENKIFQDNGDDTVRLKDVTNTKRESSFSFVDTGGEKAPSYQSIAFAEVLGPADFEAR